MVKVARRSVREAADWPLRRLASIQGIEPVTSEVA